MGEHELLFRNETAYCIQGQDNFPDFRTKEITPAHAAAVASHPSIFHVIEYKAYTALDLV
jgi:hypothetical protein